MKAKIWKNSIMEIKQYNLDKPLVQRKKQKFKISMDKQIKIHHTKSCGI
jgi:hypothetical protein